MSYLASTAPQAHAPVSRAAVWPAVAPYDPANPRNAAYLESRLLALRSDDSSERVNALNGLRAMPRAMVKEAWAQTRWQKAPPGFENECLHRVFVEKPASPLVGPRAFVTVISSGYEPMLRALLDSLALRGNCPNVPFIVFCVGDDAFDALDSWPDVTRIRCQAHERLSPAVKGAIYSCTRFLSYESMVALEADMLVVDDLNPLFEQVERGHERNFYGCRHQGQSETYTFGEVLGHMNAPTSDLEWLTQTPGFDAQFVFNGGVLAGSWAAWKAVDAGFEALNPLVSLWIEGAFHMTFADEMALNMVLHLSPKTLAPCELAPAFNVQLIDADISHWVQETDSGQGARFWRLGEPARVLHFISEKNRLFEIAGRLMAPLAPVPRYSYAFRCRGCGFCTSCGDCIAPDSIAVEPLRSGERSVLCGVCDAERQGLVPEVVPLSLRVEVARWKRDRENS